jgi:hypothetical protein
MLEEKYKNAFETLNKMGKSFNTFVKSNVNFDSFNDFLNYIEKAEKTKKVVPSKRNGDFCFFPLSTDIYSNVFINAYPDDLEITDCLYPEDLKEYLLYHPLQLRIVYYKNDKSKDKKAIKKIKKFLKSLDLTEIGIKDATKLLECY